MLAPRLRHWLKRVLGRLEKRWKEVTRSWPEPWLQWRGRVEEAEGTLIEEQTRAEFLARFSIWQDVGSRRPRVWGGSGEVLSHDWLPATSFELVLQDGRRGRIVPTTVQNGVVVYFDGTGPYPESLQSDP